MICKLVFWNHFITPLLQNGQTPSLAEYIPQWLHFLYFGSRFCSVGVASMGSGVISDYLLHILFVLLLHLYLNVNTPTL